MPPTLSCCTQQLPTINLPNFNGNYTDWTPFYESFRSLIHENNNLEKIQKLHYLRSCLGAEARRTIDTLAVSADSYDTAWRLLKERLIVQHHIHGLFNLPQITKPSPSSLRDLTDKLNAHLESLKSQNLEVEKWDAMIIYLIASKFVTQTKGEWETKLTSNELPSLQDMKSFLIQKCQTLESIEFATSSTPQYVHTTKPKPTEAPKRFNTASSLCIRSVRSSYNSTQTRDTTTSETSNCALIVSKVVMTQRPANREHAKRVAKGTIRQFIFPNAKQPLDLM
jgi:hypothetical protein